MTTIQSAIVGMQFHPGANDKLDSITDPEQPVTLVPEPNNKYDKHAIRCEIDGQVCGFIPRHQAKNLVRDIDEGRSVTATLSGRSTLRIEVEKVEKPEPSDQPL